MMANLQYTLKSCLHYATSQMPKSQKSRILPLASNSMTLNQSTPPNSSLCWIICVSVVVFLLSLILGIAASATTRKSVVLPPAAILKDSLWISPAPTQNIAFSIYVLPSLLDSLESVSDTTSSTLISTQTRPKIVSGTISIDYQNQ